MSVTIKSPAEIEKMRIAGRLAASVLEMIEPHVKAGISTDELNDICHDYTVNEIGCTSAPLNYKGFPKSICTSLNDEVCHGIPSNRILKSGDILNIDITVIKDEYHGDTSKMFLIGKTKPYADRLCRITQEALMLGISMVKPGMHLGSIGYAIETFAHKNHYSVVEDYCGHGIGKGFHEDPQVKHYGRRKTGMKLQAGMTFTIEPMLNMGVKHTKLLADKWTVKTRDRKLSAQWEHTLLVTPDGVEILTLRDEER